MPPRFNKNRTQIQNFTDIPPVGTIKGRKNEMNPGKVTDSLVENAVNAQLLGL
jgi:hypothetical protein